MSFEKLSAADERKVLKLIEKAVYFTRTGESPTDAMCKAASDVSVQPELLKRACEAFNKSKSIHMLSHTASDKRANSFDLVDGEAVFNRLYKDAGKDQTQSEKLSLPSTDFAELGMPFFKTAMQKEASEHTTEVNDAVGIKRTLKKARNDSHLIKSAASIMKQVRLESEIAIDKAVDFMYHKPEGELHKVARLLVNKYGEEGETMVKILSAKLHKELPMEKTASYAVFPFTEPYISLVKAMDRAQEYRDLKKNFIDKAAALIDLPVQAAVAGSNVLKGYADPLVDLAKVPAIEFMTKEKDTGSKALAEVLNPEMRNKLKAMDASQNFIDVAADPYLKNYSINQIAEAYNNVTGTMPELQKPRYKGWLSSLVRKQLVQGNTFDPNEIANLASASQAIARADSERKRSATESVLSQKETAKSPKAPSSTLGAAIANMGKGDSGGSVGSLQQGSLKDLLGEAKEPKEQEQKPGKIPSPESLSPKDREEAYKLGMISKEDPTTKLPYSDFAAAEKDTSSPWSTPSFKNYVTFLKGV
jgi:hypothetical protein